MGTEGAASEGFAADHTESSHKFTIAMFSRPAAEAGWSANKTWISDAPRVALFRLEPAVGENL